MVLILAVFLFGVSLCLLGLGIIGAILTVALRILAAILWVAVKILEHRSAVADDREHLITIIIDDERPMRDVTPRLKAINGPRPKQGR
jgi:hypothetical protein